MLITARLAVVLAVLNGLLAVSAPQATADHDCQLVNTPQGKAWDCTSGHSPGEPGTPGGGGGEEPPCTFDATYHEFCDGEAACWGNDPAANPPSEDLAGPRPSPEHHMAYKMCKRPDGSTYDEWYWSKEGEGPTPGQLAETVHGSLDIPAFTPVFNPPTRTLVNLDTWWRAEGAVAEASASAGPMTAEATNARLLVDPGDGAPEITCPLVTEQSDECIHVYRRADDVTASMRIVYDVTFTFHGQPFTPTDPTLLTFETPPQTTEVAVREVQTVVKPRN
jgi:hypothetical protein